MADKIVALSQVSSEQTLNDRQSLQDFRPPPFDGRVVDKNIFYQYVNGASQENLQNHMQMSQSELSSSVLNATEIPYQINTHARAQPSAFNQIFQTAGGVSRENAFSVSGQKVVHFKESASIDNQQLSSEDRPNNFKSALHHLQRNGPRGLTENAQSNFKVNFLNNGQERRISKKRFILGKDENGSGEKSALDKARQIISKSALSNKASAALAKQHVTSADQAAQDQPYFTGKVLHKTVSGQSNKPIFSYGSSAEPTKLSQMQMQYRTVPRGRNDQPPRAASQLVSAFNGSGVNNHRRGWLQGDTHHEEPTTAAATKGTRIESIQQSGRSHDEPAIEIEGEDAKICLVSPVQKRSSCGPFNQIISEDCILDQSNGITNATSSNGLSFGNQQQKIVDYVKSQQPSPPLREPHVQLEDTENVLLSDSGSKTKPPQIPSLKQKLHQASLQLHGVNSESAGESTTVNNLSNSNTKMSIAPMTAGTNVLKGNPIFTGGGELHMTGQRGSVTQMSQLTPTQQPLTGDDPRYQNNLPQLLLQNTQNLKEAESRPALTPQDVHSLMNFKLQEDRRATEQKQVLDMQTPYHYLGRPNDQVVGALNYERAKKRRQPLRFTQEIDCAVSETNYHKMIYYREQLSFRDWFSLISAKSNEVAQRRNTQARKFLN